MWEITNLNWWMQDFSHQLLGVLMLAYEIIPIIPAVLIKTHVRTYVFNQGAGGLKIIVDIFGWNHHLDTGPKKCIEIQQIIPQFLGGFKLKNVPSLKLTVCTWN